MNTKQLLALSAIAAALLGASGAHAETYEGVHAITSGATRSDVNVEAVAAARAGNVYADGADDGVATVNSTLARSDVNDQAVAAAHNPLQSLDRRAFYRDEVPAQYRNPGVSFTRQAAR